MRSVSVVALLVLTLIADGLLGPAAAQTTITVTTQDVISAVPKTVYGEGLLNYVASDAFVRSGPFQDVVKASQVGALRWPGAGHSNIPIFHFDNRHTYYAKNGPYSTKSKGNIWDPLYPLANSGPAEEIVTLGGFVDVLRNTDTGPLMIFTWRSAELWRDIDGKRVFYRDPDPRTLSGEAMSAADAAKLSSREMQFLENRRMLQDYYALGGPPNPITQIGEELWAGWEDGQVPWDDPQQNPKKLKKGKWISEALVPYFADLEAFAAQNGYPIQMAVQFRESDSGGDQMPLSKKEVAFLAKDFDQLLAVLGPKLSYMTASVHYRGTWDRWLTEPQMQLAFMTDSGQGSLAEIRAWFRARVAAKGFPAIDIIPHANSFGEVADGEPSPQDWQTGLMASQYMIESIKAGYTYTFGFPGFLGDYTGIAGQNSGSKFASSESGSYKEFPIAHALTAFGEALQNKAQLVAVASDDDAVISLGLVTAEASGPHHLWLYFINKHASAVTATVGADINLAAADISVSRYSESETTFAQVAASSVIGGQDGSGMTVTLAPFSMTMVKVSLN